MNGARGCSVELGVLVENPEKGSNTASQSRGSLEQEHVTHSIISPLPPSIYYSEKTAASRRATITAVRLICQATRISPRCLSVGPCRSQRICQWELVSPKGGTTHCQMSHEPCCEKSAPPPVRSKGRSSQSERSRLTLPWTLPL